MKPNKELRKKFETDYFDISEFASNARLLQSIWRVENGYDFEKYGNFLKEDFSKKNGANFLTENIFELVKKEVDNKHVDGKMIKEPRIWNNLLSSQPLAFNLFGELKLNLELSTIVFQTLYPFRNIKRIISIEFEYSPGRKNPKYTNDSSAFDVFITYENIINQNGIFGIEVKYAENLNDQTATHKEIYEIISEKSGVFDLSNIPKLKEKPIQQIWRDHLLTLSLFITNKDYSIGDFIYLYPNDNNECKSGIQKYQETFNENVDNYFIPLTIEKLTETIKINCDEKWINDFENRYLDFSKIEKVCS